MDTSTKERQLRTYKFVFRIRRVHLDQIMKAKSDLDRKKIEYRTRKPFWTNRVLEANSGKYSRILGVFICGKTKHIREIPLIEPMRTPGAVSCCDVDSVQCYGFHLGLEVKEYYCPYCGALNYYVVTENIWAVVPEMALTCENVKCKESFVVTNPELERWKR